MINGTTGRLRLGAAALAGLMAGLVMAGPALADHGHRWGRGGIEQLAERYDANRDGAISQQEIDQNRTQWHGEFDGDKTGDLSIAEFERLWLKARRLEMVREFQRFDRDGDGKVTLEEYRRPLADLVRDMDRNGDGMLSRDDRQRRMQREDRENEQ
jgi:Ca2+-binding EF-hand superfamily protein